MTQIAFNDCGTDTFSRYIALGVDSTSCGVTLQETIDNNFEVLLYPNPNEGSFNLEFSNMEIPEKVEIFSIDGKIIREFKESDFSQSVSVISIDNPSPGMYILICHFEGQRIIKHFAVIRR